MLWLNGQHIRLLSVDNLYARVTNFWPDSAADASDESKKQVLALVQDRLKTLTDLPVITDYFFTDPTPNWHMIDDNKQLKKLPREDHVELLRAAKAALEQSEFDAESIQQTLNTLIETTGQKPGILFSLIRLSVSWAPFSPALNDTLAVIGKQSTLSRIQKAIETA